VNWGGPCYIRSHRTKGPIIHQYRRPEFKIGKGIIVREGTDLTIIATGWIINNVLKAAEMLAAENISVRVISMHTTKPLDKELILDSAQNTGGIITVEDQVTNGLGAAVGLTLATFHKYSKHSIPFTALGLTDNYSYEVGSEEYHLEKSGLSPKSIYSIGKNMWLRSL